MNLSEPPPDVEILTSGGRSIAAHSGPLAAASAVLESEFDKNRSKGKAGIVVPILGVPCGAVDAFVRFLYSSADHEVRDEMEKYGMHLLVLSHAYQVSDLKRACEVALAAGLTVESVVDVLHLAAQCDAPRLRLSCMRLLAADFGSVERTEAWRFLQAHDPWQELEILQFLEESDSTLQQAKQWRKKREQQGVYLQLNESMDCLLHICTDGCTDVGPAAGPAAGEPPSKNKRPCPNFHVCHGLQLLLRHFAACCRTRPSVAAAASSSGDCRRCRRMLQLFRLHSAICDQPEPCKVPLCKQFKERKQEMEGKVEDGKWEVLVKKVAAARVMSSLEKKHRKEIAHHS